MFLNPMSTFNVSRDIDLLDMVREIETIRAEAAKSSQQKVNFSVET